VKIIGVLAEDVEQAITAAGLRRDGSGDRVAGSDRVLADDQHPHVGERLPEGT
jgi:hypothetical protein